MAQTFDGLAAFAAHLRAQIASAPGIERHAIDHASAQFLEAVKAIPGRYQDGWPALTEATQEDRVAKGFTADDPLKRTGGFADSFEREMVNHRHAVIGSADERAPAFEYGTRTMPPRPVMAIADAQMGEHVAHAMARAIHRHLAGHAGGD